MTILSILLAIALLGILITVHEFGHFMAARLTGIAVKEYSVGLGPKLIQWQSRKHETLFTLRPIPMLAWVPLAILMWPGREASIVFLTFLGSYFATVLNTLLGVESIDESYFRAARSLGARPRDVFFKVILPGAMPFIFTGLQISMGYAWFSLVAGEMLAGEYGLGYLIWNSFMLVQYPVIIIAMITLGVIGSLSSLLIRMIGNRLMQWKVREEVR